MIDFGFILLPLYIWPTTGAWPKLFHQAITHPHITFYTIINPDSGPGGSSCPGQDYVDALARANSFDNIKTLAYVHTANRWDCGEEGTEICTCSAPIGELKANITTYADWTKSGCRSDDIHIDGFFMDEAPSNAKCAAYMHHATTFAKGEIGQDKPVFFNAGTGVDEVYWGIADYINVFEDTEAAYESADIAALDGDGKYARQSTMILHNYTGGKKMLKRDVETILGSKHDALAGLYITDSSGYTEFGSDWAEFVDDVGRVVRANMAAMAA